MQKDKRNEKLISYAERQKSYFLCIKTNILFLMRKDKYLISFVGRQKILFLMHRETKILLCFH